uniref:TSA: Wollemia nobilis Ref_Wollemi_Transcript_13059_2970 transcribed RNA sequence n=1 Tax=Wollemia nobilis TaxID=56998 RepID=A0A0C9S5A6_9CONI
MSFGGFVENGSGGRLISEAFFHSISNNMPSGAVVQPRLAPPGVMPLARPAKGLYTSPGLSLALTSGMVEGQGEVGTCASESEAGKNKDEEYESRSGSDNMDGGSGDEQDAENPPRKKRYHRHTPQQIQELEALFKECPHPDEKQRLELSRRLNLETRQVKFWFQNRRTQMKTQLERHENTMLRQENEKLRTENMSIRDAMRNPICSNCGGSAVLGEMSMEEHQLRIENARLKEELDRVCAIAGKFFGRLIPSSISPASMMPKSSLDLAVGAMPTPLPPARAVTELMHAPTAAAAAPPPSSVAAVAGGGGVRIGNGSTMERTILAELALASMDELVKMAQTDEPLWTSNLDGGGGGRETLNYEEYMLQFPSIVTPKPLGMATEATRETGMVIMSSLNLVQTLMDVNRWKEMFPCIVSKAATVDVISSGMGGTRNGALLLIYAELQVLSPLVSAREVYFLRFCKQHAEGVWAVADVSVDNLRENLGAPPSPKCRRLPSGCLVQDMPNGYSKVTWVEHAEYDDRGVHRLYRSLLNSGVAFGAQRWVETLRRQCECFAILMSTSVPSRDPNAIPTPSGRRSMLKLAKRMTDNFCAGVSASTVHSWNKLSGNIDDDVRVMTRKSVDDPGEPPGVVLSAATSVWLPVSPQRLFDFLRDERLRSEWDILSNGGPMQEMAHIPKGQDPANCVSLLRASAMNSNQSSMLILQETCTDASGSLVVYAPVDIPAMHTVMSGGDSAYVALLPSGFAILPDGPECRPLALHAQTGNGVDGQQRVGGSLLTVAFQILVNSLPTAKLTVESVETVNNLISCTVQKIKAALHCEDA